MPAVASFLKMHAIEISLVAILLAVFTFSAYSEVIPVNDGKGVDGEFYYSVAKSFLDDIGTVGYDNFRIQRIFPFCLINIFLAAFSIEPTHQVLMTSMYLAHYLNLAILLAFFFKLAKHLQWKRNTTLILFSCMFFNYFFLKNCCYEPFQTDSFAITIFLVSYYYLLKKKTALSIAVATLGLLNWPTVTYSLMLLTLFSNSFPKDAKVIKINPGKAFAILVPLMSIGAAALLYIIHKEEILGNIVGNPISIPMILVSLVAEAGLLYIIMRKISYRFPTPMEFIRNTNWKLLAAMAIPLIIVTVVLKVLSNGAFYFNGSAFILQSILRPLKYPFITPVSHFVFFGILPLLALVYAKDYAKKFLEINPGHALVFFIFFFFAVDSEARHIIPYLPLLIVPLGSILDQRNISLKGALSLIGIQLALSHFYYPINSAGFEELFNNGDFANPVVQRYMMNYGPWVNGEFFLFWAILWAICAILLYVKHPRP